MTYGFKDDKSKVEVYSKAELISKLANGGKFVKYTSTETLTKGQIKEVTLTQAQIQNMFGTDDTSKIHILSTSIYRVVETISGYNNKAWGNAYFYNTSAGNVTYTIPYVELFNKNEYPWLEDRLGRVFLYNQNQVANTESVTWRIFAFVED